MCGILGILSLGRPITVMESLLRLKKLEYRGYDSAGFATCSGNVKKFVGDIDSFIEFLDENEKKEKTKAIILHTRWATHGLVSEKNAHPQHDCKKEIFVVHNGIIENYKILREELKKKGHIFFSDTDTEVIPHIIEENKNLSDKELLQKLKDKLEGTYAIVILFKNKHKLLFLKKGSPLVLGISKDYIFLSSDLYSFVDKTNTIITLDDYEFGIVDKNGVKIFDRHGKLVLKKPVSVKLVNFEEKNDRYEHNMLKEILEQPKTTSILINSLNSTQKRNFEELVDSIQRFKKIVFLAAGSSYHASLIGAYLLRKLGYDAYAVLASEYEQYFLYDKNTLLIPVSQSGETMDVIVAIKDLKKKVGKIFSIVNVPYSTIQRISDRSIEIMAGQEKAVAATKTYTNQVVLFYNVAKKIGLNIDVWKIPRKIYYTILSNLKNVVNISKKLKHENNIFIIGRGISYFASLEIALKLKEISYVHAEALAGGELKHGTLALIENNTPVISLLGYEHEIYSNIKEVESRGAKTIVFGKDFVIPMDDITYPIYHVVLGQLLTYYIAKNKGLPIDKPRNLAKSVTVI